MKKAMRKGLISLITGAATVASPMAFAAQDTSGMQYTSAAEGFYASIRARYSSGGTKDDGADIQNASSRIGVRGTNDLGGGLSGFYQWELGVGIDDGSDTSVRQGHVGLRGNFGEVMLGSFWDQTYNWTYGSTDVANTHSGNLIYNPLLPGRVSRSLQYSTPDLNGFQAALRVTMDKGIDGETIRDVVTDDTETFTVGHDSGNNPKDDNDLDAWAISAKYAVQGFDVATSYLVLSEVIDGNGDGRLNDDWSAYVFKAGYAQDNWYVNAWYSADNADDEQGITQENTIVSVAGGVSVDKVNVYAVYETMEDTDKKDTTHGTVGVQYNLGSNSRVWVEYANQDIDTNKDAEDYVNIGLRHDF